MELLLYMLLRPEVESNMPLYLASELEGGASFR